MVVIGFEPADTGTEDFGDVGIGLGVKIAQLKGEALTFGQVGQGAVEVRQ